MKYRNKYKRRFRGRSRKNKFAYKMRKRAKSQLYTNRYF